MIKKVNPDESKEKRIGELARQIREAEGELRELAPGQLYFRTQDGNLSHATQAASGPAPNRLSAEQHAAILDAIPAHVALLDSDGVILAVNEAWRRFASANVLQSSDFFVGQNYLGTCESAHGECADEAQAVATGIRKVLSGETKEFGIEYPCHSPNEQRWFRLMVTPLSETPGAGVVVMHVNVTERRLAEAILSQREREQRQLAEKLASETRRLHESQAVANVGSWETDLTTLEVMWTDETYRIFETSREEFEVTHQGFLARVHPEDQQRVEEAFLTSVGDPGPFAIEHRLLFPDGRIKFVEERWRAFNDATGTPVRAVGTCQDITQRKLADGLIRIRARQQEAIAMIGFEATRATTLESLFDFATRAVAQALGVKLCKVMQLVPDGGHLRLVSGVGWQAGLIGVGTVGVDLEFDAGFTLKSDGPIYVNNFARETRFKASPLLQQHDVVSGLSVRILLRDKPWGVLGAHCRTARNFNDGDADFMQTVATLLAVVIERLAVQRILTESEARMRDAQRIAHLGNWELDIAKNELTWSEEVFRIFGVEPAGFSATYEAFLALVHPDDREAMQAAQSIAIVGRGPLEIEHRIIRGDSEIRFIRERGELIHDENGLPIALSGTVLDITDLRLAQSQAERMNALLSEAQRIAAMGSWEMDLATGRLMWPKETCHLFGIQPEEFGGTFEEFTKFILPEDRPAFSAVHAKITPTAPLLEAEYRIRRPDGTVRWMFERGMVTFDSAGKVARRLGVVMDITGRRKNEEQLRLLETCVSRLNDIVLITEAEPIDDPGPRILYVNDAFVRRTGFSREEAIGKTPRLLQGPKTQRDALDRIRAALKAWKPVREELINYTKSGEEFWLELDIVPVADATGWFTHWVAIERDITERKRIQEALAESQRQYRDLVETSHNVIWTVDLEGRFTFLNQASRAIFGRTPEEMTGQRFHEFVPEDQHQANDEIFARMLREGQDVIDYSNRIRRKDGSIAILNSNARVVRDAQGQMIGISGMSQNTTEVVRAQEAIAQSEARFRGLFDQAAVGMSIKSAEGIFLRTNERFCEIVGYSAEELLRHGGIEITHLDDRERETETVARMLAGELQTAAWEKRYLHKAGHAVWCNLTLSLLPGGSGQPPQFVGVIEDITERRLATEKLRQNERVLHIAGKIARMGGWSVDLPEGRVIWSETVYAIFGLPPGSELSLEQRFNYFTPESQALIRPAFDACAQTGTPYDLELEMIDAHGRHVWVRTTAEAEFDETGAVKRVQGAIQDITERKQAAEALANSESRLRLALDASRLGTFEWNVVTNALKWSGWHEELWGYSPGEFKGTYEEFAARVHPDDLSAVVRELARCIDTHNRFAKEFRVVWPDGSIHWIASTGEFTFSDTGQALRMHGAVMDITERKSAEEQLRTSAHRLALATEAGGVGVWDYEVAGNRLIWDDQMFRLYGTTREQFSGAYEAWQAGVHPDDRQRGDDEFQQALRGERNFDTEFRVVWPDGSTHCIRAIAAIERDAAGKAVRVVGTNWDFTERKRAEEALAGIVQVQQEIAQVNLPLSEMMQLMAQRARTLTRATGGAVEFVEGAEMVYAAVAGVIADKIGLRLKREGSLSGLAFTTGEVLSCEDTETDPRVELPLCRQVGARSMIVAPLRVGEEIIGVLKVLSGEPHAFAKRDVQNLRILVETLGVVIQRQRAAEALRASGEEFRNLAEVMPQIVWITRADGWNIYFNQHWMEYTGLTLEESLGHGWNKPFHPEDHQRAWDAWQLATSTVGTYTLECRLRRADGEYRWWLIRGEPQKDAAGHVLKWFGTCTDIHDLKIAELEITRTNRALKMLSDCHEALIHAEEERVLLDEICQIAVASGGYRMAWVGFAQEDAKRTIQPMAHAGEEAGYLSEVVITWEENTREGSGPAGRTIRTGQPNMSEDMEQDASFHWRDVARQRGYRSVICLPLRTDNRTFGLLGLYSAEALQASAEEIKLLQELADDLAFGIQTLRSRIATQKMQQAVIAIASGVSSAVGGAFFSSLLRHTIEALHADAGFLAVLETPESRSARTITAIIQSGEIDNFDYSIKGTPCEQMVLGRTCLVEQNVQAQYPEDRILAAHRIEAYAGTPLLNSQGAVIGLISVLFQKPIVGEKFIPSTLQIFAARAASELERQKSDQQLREQAALLDAAYDAIFVKDLEDRVLYWNKGAERLYGWASTEVIGRKTCSFLCGDLNEVENAFQKVLKNDRWEGELHKLSKEGKPLHVQASWTLVRDSDGRPTSVLAINSDLTEKKKLEAQFLRAQRMESIGTLAGGIAHDLNNVLAPIMMSVELLKLTTNEEDQKLLATLMSSAQRGANLVSQVLSFARGVEGQRIPVNVGHLIRELVRVMRETFPKNLTIEHKSSASLWTVIGDPTQIHQVILNLCVNARDAMPNGGKLTIAAENIVLDDTYASMNLNARPSSYVVIKVEDSGTGIPPELMERIFEPFFTTKEIGRGTGLGLSTTMAIVKSHGGFINLYSELGKGTKFKVYFPADASKEASEERSIEQTRLPRGKGELILVVDDEENIRSVAKSTLERFGYSVMIAAHGAEAIAIYAQNQSAVAVVLTDMAMPIMDGPTLIVALKSINPKVRVIGSSGLTSNGGNAKAVGAGVEHFIPKPYTAEAMLKSIRAVLDSH